MVMYQVLKDLGVGSPGFDPGRHHLTSRHKPPCIECHTSFHCFSLTGTATENLLLALVNLPNLRCCC
ncbi:hypothetical protein RIF29_28688 [Crotalaria pallida]|uniref:Uncharacterized protein n=1 Tax=Crotalaria pallida TaxID=3830 RepID=A0AAN9HZL4_CROPI